MEGLTTITVRDLIIKAGKRAFIPDPEQVYRYNRDWLLNVSVLNPYKIQVLAALPEQTSIPKLLDPNSFIPIDRLQRLQSRPHELHRGPGEEVRRRQEG